MKSVDFVFAARPLLLVPIWSIYLVSLHFHHELTNRSFGLDNLLSLVALTLLGAGACYINQVYDAKSDRINNKVLFVSRGLITVRGLILGFIVTGIAAIGLGALVSGLFLFDCSQLLLLSYCYSAPPLRLKDRPVAGLMANAYGIGFVGSIAVYPTMSVDNAGLLGWDNPFYFAMAVGAVYLLTTIPDTEGDRLTGKQTVAVAAGKRVTALLALAWLIVAVIAAWNSQFVPLFWIAAAAALVTVVAVMVSSPKAPLIAAKLPILLLTVLAGWYYPLYLIFIVVLVVSTRIYYHRRFGLRYPSVA